MCYFAQCLSVCTVITGWAQLYYFTQNVHWTLSKYPPSPKRTIECMFKKIYTRDGVVLVLLNLELSAALFPVTSRSKLDLRCNQNSLVLIKYTASRNCKVHSFLKNLTEQVLLEIIDMCAAPETCPTTSTAHLLNHLSLQPFLRAFP